MAALQLDMTSASATASSSMSSFLLPLHPLLRSLPALPYSDHPHFDGALHILLFALFFLLLLQSYAFSTPPPVPRKKLPPQPTINLEFSPRTSSEEGLPESFAPLLSSSHLEVIYAALTADQLHALAFEGSLSLAPGTHAIPFHKAPLHEPPSNRPPLLVAVPLRGSTVNVSASVGSDTLTAAKDFDPDTPMSTRSSTMVKNVALSITPPLHLSNVAATLVHLPHLFEDHAVPSMRANMRRVQILQWALDFLASFTSWFEKLLWGVEQYLQIHLSKVTVLPVYRGGSSPHFRLSLSFSGTVTLFNLIPIPFISLSLPTMIIPAPHALLTKLATEQPLASAEIKHSNIPADAIALAGCCLVEKFTGTIKVLATPPTVGVDVTVPGGMNVRTQILLGLGGGGAAPDDGAAPVPKKVPDNNSNNSNNRRTRTSLNRGTSIPSNKSPPKPPLPYDANTDKPWSFDIALHATIKHSEIKVNVTTLRAAQQGKTVDESSRLEAACSFEISLPDTAESEAGPAVTTTLVKQALGLLDPPPSSRSSRNNLARNNLARNAPPPSQVALDHSYNFTLLTPATLSTVTVNITAAHPMLKGGTNLTLILQHLLTSGSLLSPPSSRLYLPPRKRDVMRFLPVVDFRGGVGNFYVPRGSGSFTDDGITRVVPVAEVREGRGRVFVQCLCFLLCSSCFSFAVSVSVSVSVSSNKSLLSSVNNIGIIR